MEIVACERNAVGVRVEMATGGIERVWWEGWSLLDENLLRMLQSWEERIALDRDALFFVSF